MQVRWYVLGGSLAIVLVTVLLLGVRGMKSDQPPIQIFPDMKLQPKYHAQGENRFFADRRDMRLPPPGTVAYGGRNYQADAGRIVPNPDFLQEDDGYYRALVRPESTVRNALGAASSVGQWLASDHLTRLAGAAGTQAFWAGDARLYVDRIPGWSQIESKKNFVNEGRAIFNSTCAICHGLAGNGKGVTKSYGMNPANLHDPAIVNQPDGKIHETISNGRGTMKGYAHMIRPAERWKVVAYVRALQESQRATAADIPPERKRELGINP